MPAPMVPNPMNPTSMSLSPAVRALPFRRCDNTRPWQRQACGLARSVVRLLLPRLGPHAVEATGTASWWPDALALALPPPGLGRDAAPGLTCPWCRGPVNYISAPWPPARAAFFQLAKETRTAQQFLELRVDVDDERVARICPQRCLEIGNDAAKRLSPKGIEQEEHDRLRAVVVIDDVHAKELELRALLRRGTVALDVFLRDVVQVR